MSKRRTAPVAAAAHPRTGVVLLVIVALGEAAAHATLSAPRALCLAPGRAATVRARLFASLPSAAGLNPGRPGGRASAAVALSNAVASTIDMPPTAALGEAFASLDDPGERAASPGSRSMNAGSSNAMWGRTHSTVVRRQLSRANTGNKNPNFGKRHSEETRQLIADKLRSAHARRKLERAVMAEAVVELDAEAEQQAAIAAVARATAARVGAECDAFPFQTSSGSSSFVTARMAVTDAVMGGAAVGARASLAVPSYPSDARAGRAAEGEGGAEGDSAWWQQQKRRQQRYQQQQQQQQLQQQQQQLREHSKGGAAMHEVGTKTQISAADLRLRPHAPADLGRTRQLSAADLRPHTAGAVRPTSAAARAAAAASTLGPAHSPARYAGGATVGAAAVGAALVTGGECSQGLGSVRSPGAQPGSQAASPASPPAARRKDPVATPATARRTDLFELDSFRHELLSFINANGTSGEMPTVIALKTGGRYDLCNALYRHHGGAESARLALGLRPASARAFATRSTTRAVKGHWTSFESVRSALLEMTGDALPEAEQKSPALAKSAALAREKAGLRAGTMPSRVQFESTRPDLLNAITRHHGGVEHVALRLGLRIVKRKPQLSAKDTVAKAVAKAKAKAAVTAVGVTSTGPVRPPASAEAALLAAKAAATAAAAAKAAAAKRAPKAAKQPAPAAVPMLNWRHRFLQDAKTKNKSAAERSRFSKVLLD
ncbi:hypothetical protein T492DRAFT_933648 [Pavlovales sp. CCMP2436]|nr:hypothetical protein T492DRAFT_933648 [Pavlovales sp. CCMP2436]